MVSFNYKAKNEAALELKPFVRIEFSDKNKEPITEVRCHNLTTPAELIDITEDSKSLSIKTTDPWKIKYFNNKQVCVAFNKEKNFNVVTQKLFENVTVTLSKYWRKPLKFLYTLSLNKPLPPLFLLGSKQYVELHEQENSIYGEYIQNVSFENKIYNKIISRKCRTTKGCLPPGSKYCRLFISFYPSKTMTRPLVEIKYPTIVEL